MGKAIYCLQLLMLEFQLTLTGRKKTGMEQVTLFAALVYCKQWHETPISKRAPLNDVLFFEIIKTYYDQTVAKGTRTNPETPPVVRFRGKRGIGPLGLKERYELEYAYGQGNGQVLLEEAPAIAGKKDDDGFLFLILRHIEDTVLLSETRRGLPSRGPGIV